MIVIGMPKGWEPDPGRMQALKEGAIIIVLETDRILNIWLGEGPRVDLLMCRIHTENNGDWLMGRVRFHVDERMFESRDHKEVIQLVAPHGFDFSVPVRTFLALATASGVRTIHERRCDAPSNELQSLIMDGMSKFKSGGWRLMSTEDPEKEQRIRDAGKVEP